MVQVLYADKDILVAVKPAGVESQAAKRFAPDMVSEIRKYLVIHKLCTPGKEPDVYKRQGGALGLSGYLLQTFFRNPIAGPFVLGISSGAKLLVACLMVFSLGLSLIHI